MIKGYIYVITNDINGKQYVGKTCAGIEERWRTHCRDRHKLEARERPLYRAMNKYGLEHFSIQQLEECDQSILNEREAYWIERLNTYHEGYNATLGGDGSAHVNYENIITDYKNGLSPQEISAKYQYHIETVRDYINKAGIEKRPRIINDSIPVKQFSLQNEFIQEFPSSGAAARWIYKNNSSLHSHIDVIAHHIVQAAKGERQSAYKYHWELVNIEDKERVFNKNKPIKCLNNNMVFNTVREATEWCGLRDIERIRACCHNCQQTAGKHPITHEPLQW